MPTSRHWLIAANWMLLTGLATLSVGLTLASGVLRAIVLYLAFTLLGLLLVCLLCALFEHVRARRAANLGFPYSHRFSPLGNIKVRWLDACNTEEIDAVFRLREEMVPTASVDAEIIRERIRLHPNICRLIFVRHGDEFRIDGYGIVYPLSKSAVTEILAGDIRGGAGIRRRQILNSWRRVSGIYIASAAGRSRVAKLAVVGMLEALVDQVSPQWVFARSVTNDSLRLMKHAGFVPVHDSIWGLELKRPDGDRGVEQKPAGQADN